MVYLTRVEHFNAGHRLYNKQWGLEKNLTVFGKCANENYHGHNYELHITIKGEPHLETGYIFNAKTLGRVVRERVLEKVDHRNLNLDVDFMKDINPTTENLAINIWKQLEVELKKEGAQLHHIRLYETPKIYVDYYGD